MVIISPESTAKSSQCLGGRRTVGENNSPDSDTSYNEQDKNADECNPETKTALLMHRRRRCIGRSQRRCILRMCGSWILLIGRRRRRLLRSSLFICVVRSKIGRGYRDRWLERWRHIAALVRRTNIDNGRHYRSAAYLIGKDSVTATNPLARNKQTRRLVGELLLIHKCPIGTAQIDDGVSLSIGAYFGMM